jgi:hypothetical protein
MRSSISSSESTILENLRSEPVVVEKRRISGSVSYKRFERPVPLLPWLRILLIMIVTTVTLTGAWEFAMRHLGLRASDLDDGRAYWTVERRKIDSAPRDSVVIIGDSRILLDTDLAVWERLTGHRPIQLALMGTNAQPILHDLAADEHFAGLLVIGTAEFSYFSDDAGSYPRVLNFIKSESPSQRTGHYIHKALSRYLAFLDSNYTLFKLVERHKWPERKGVESPYVDVWKISESYDDRQTFLWDRIERDDYLRRQAQFIWMRFFTGTPVAANTVERVSAKTKVDIERIRARGGEVVWVRPPSSGPLLEIERARYPRPEVWDRLVHDTESVGIYFEDYPTMQNLPCPDWSHLSRAAAKTFTEAYVTVLRDRVEWLRVRPTRESLDTRLNTDGK